MDFLSTIAALLEPVAPGGAFYGEMPKQPFPVDAGGVPLSWITWQRITGADNVDLDGASDLQATTIQVDILAARITAAEAIKRAADAALATLPQTVPLSSNDQWDDVVQMWRITREYSVWFTNS